MLKKGLRVPRVNEKKSGKNRRCGLTVVVNFPIN